MADRHRPALRRWALVGILWLAFGLRIYRLGADSLWYDETVSVHLAGKSIPALVDHTAGDIHPPGYYLLLHAWTRLAGSSEYAAAYLSLFFGVLLVALAYHLTTSLLGWRVGLLAALLVAVSPYNLWYSQEVRMYTLGAVLGMGLLVAVVRLLTGIGARPSWRWLAVYVLCGALGLWTLYYFAFLLAAVNAMVLGWWLATWRRGSVGWAWLGWWLLAQAVVLLFYSPWLPVAWRQAVQPPVPPWRGFTSLGEVLIQTWGALGLGQSIEAAHLWPLLLLVAALFLVGLSQQTAQVRGKPRAWPVWMLAGYVWLPILFIYLASLISPLYHVRYAFLYSTPFYAVLAAGLVWLGQRWRPALWLGLAAILLLSCVSIFAYHTNARYTSDDHRAAVRFLAERWRPGDGILLDAGYAYPALLTYWNGDPIAWRGRLVDRPGGETPPGPLVVQAGSVDGDPGLGWGDPNSDFYAMDPAQTAQALVQLFSDLDRVWVYRIYDTVTDPSGLIRRWLQEQGTQFEERVFTGEGQLRVQGFLTGRDPLPSVDRPLNSALRDGSLQLVGSSAWAESVPVGGTLDLAPVWRVNSPPGDDWILFAGLFDQAGQRWAQADERPLGSLYPPGAWPAGATVRTPLRLEVPPGTPPGRYRLELGWYRFVDGQPVWQPWISGERVALGEVTVEPPEDWSALPVPTTRQPLGVTVGDGMRLLGFAAPRLEGVPGEALPVELYWQALQDHPVPGPVVLQLSDDAGNAAAEATGPLAAGHTSFARLAAGETVRDLRSFVLPVGLAPGVYNLRLGRRTPDGRWLPVRRGPFPLGATVPLATIRVLERRVSEVPPAVQHAVDARFGPGIHLVGYDVDATESEVSLRLYWQAMEAIGGRYTIFAHLVAEGDGVDIRAQADVDPHLPTSSWLPGEYLSDRAVVALPADLPPGRYALLIGLYDQGSGQRLPVLDGNGQRVGDSLALVPILVGSTE